MRAKASGVRFTTPRRQLEVMFAEPTEVVVRDDRRQNNFDLRVYLGVLSGNAAEKQTAKTDRIKESIAGYLVFMKEKYGVEPAAFSINEWDYGPTRQTPREHANLIKVLGAYFAFRGLATKWLLGDISHPYPISLINEGLNDPEVAKYVYALSYHSWTSGTDANLAEWDAAAQAMNVPLLIAEGGLDPSTHQYPQMFVEPFYALREIELYERILALSRPTSILHWQLTADYSLLAGGGIYRDNGPLRPTQRFWNVKQLASTPPNVFFLPAKCDRPGLTCSAYGNAASGVYAVHVVNMGAARPTTLTGLPAEVKQLRVWVTDEQRGMQEGARIPVTNGKAQFTLDQTSYTTLISAQ